MLVYHTAQLDTLIGYECFDVFYLDFDMYDRKTLIQQFADDVKSLTKRNKKVYLMLPTIFRADSSDYFVSIAKELYTKLRGLCCEKLRGALS